MLIIIIIIIIWFIKELVKYTSVLSNAHQKVSKTECTAVYPLSNCNIMNILAYSSPLRILVRKFIGELKNLSVLHLFVENCGLNLVLCWLGFILKMSLCLDLTVLFANLLQRLNLLTSSGSISRMTSPIS